MDINYERDEALKQLNARFMEECQSAVPVPEALRELTEQLSKLPITPEGVEEFKATRPWAEEDMAMILNPTEEARHRALPKTSTRLKNRLKRKRKK